jgi:hypothetical protein
MNKQKAENIAKHNLCPNCSNELKSKRTGIFKTKYFVYCPLCKSKWENHFQSLPKKNNKLQLMMDKELPENEFTLKCTYCSTLIDFEIEFCPSCERFVFPRLEYLLFKMNSELVASVHKSISVKSSRNPPTLHLKSYISLIQNEIELYLKQNARFIDFTNNKLKLVLKSGEKNAIDELVFEFEAYLKFYLNNYNSFQKKTPPVIFEKAHLEILMGLHKQMLVDQSENLAILNKIAKDPEAFIVDNNLEITLSLNYTLDSTVIKDAISKSLMELKGEQNEFENNQNKTILKRSHSLSDNIITQEKTKKKKPNFSKRSRKKARKIKIPEDPTKINQTTKDETYSPRFVSNSFERIKENEKIIRIELGQIRQKDDFDCPYCSSEIDLETKLCPSCNNIVVPKIEYFLQEIDDRLISNREIRFTKLRNINNNNVDGQAYRDRITLELSQAIDFITGINEWVDNDLSLILFNGSKRDILVASNKFNAYLEHFWSEYYLFDSIDYPQIFKRTHQSILNNLFKQIILNLIDAIEVLRNITNNPKKHIVNGVLQVNYSSYWNLDEVVVEYKKAIKEYTHELVMPSEELININTIEDSEVNRFPKNNLSSSLSREQEREMKRAKAKANEKNLKDKKSDDKTVEEIIQLDAEEPEINQLDAEELKENKPIRRRRTRNKPIRRRRTQRK